MLEKIRSLFKFPNFYFFKVNSVYGQQILELEEANKKLRSYGVKLPNDRLLNDISHLAGGGDLKEKIELEAEIRFSFFKTLPWWLKILEKINPKIEISVIKSNLISFSTFSCLAKLKLPGYKFEEKFVSAVILFFVIDKSLKKYKCPVSEVYQILQEATEIATTITEEEKILMDCIPSDEEMSELPKMLKDQFVRAKEDEEFFFSGEGLQTQYAIGKVIRHLKKGVDKKITSHITEVLNLLSHPGRFLIISTSRKLERLDSFSLVRTNRFTPDTEGQERRYRKMHSMAEIPRIQTQTLALAVLYPKLFLEKVIKFEPLVRERGVIDELRQAVCLMIDKSPSMLFKGNLFKAFGILFNRLLAVLSQDAFVLYQFFDGELSTESTVDDPDEAQMTMKFARAKNFVGSGTDIDKALLSARKKLLSLPKELRKLTPHIVLITDGRDKVEVTPEEMLGIKVHVFIMGGSNYELRRICQRTEGVYYEGL